MLPDPLFSQILRNPDQNIQTWIADWFAEHPTAEVAPHYSLVTGRDARGEMYYYARLFTAHGYLEEDKNGLPESGLNPYSEMDLNKLLFVCQSLLFSLSK